MPTQLETTLKEIVNFYLGSRDFNGLPVYAGRPTDLHMPSIRKLVEARLIQVVSASDYPNPHIRPWASRRSIDSQIVDLLAMKKPARGELDRVCLYPMRKALMPAVKGKWQDQPFRRRMAQGGGTLELAYFSTDVIEPYRNDPKYHFSAWDFGVNFGIGDKAYMDEGEPQKDKIPTVRAGFAYKEAFLKNNEIRRYLCAFLCDLWPLTPEHQRRIESYEVKPRDPQIKPHPSWWASQMGHFPDLVGVFEKILAEMQAINELFVLIYGKPLFKSTERPRGWGWLLRPSTSEWQHFVSVTDRLISDNMSGAAFKAAGVSTKDEAGNPLGTIGRLELLIRTKTDTPLENVEKGLKPFRDVRRERKRPAHYLDKEISDSTFVARQRDLLAQVASALSALRILFSSHPKAKGWKGKQWLDENFYRL